MNWLAAISLFTGLAAIAIVAWPWSLVLVPAAVWLWRRC